MPEPTVVNVTVERAVWMREVTDRVDPTLKGFMFGTVKGLPGIIAISLVPGGAGRYYCQTHQRIFRVTETCPDCVLEPALA